MMHDVIIVCEGQTEREFCKSVVAPCLAAHDQNIYLAGKLAGKPNRRQGGIRDWQVYRNDLLRTARERDGRHVGLLVDYYAMPKSWPGRENTPSCPIDERGKHVEDALRADLHSELGNRFHPCVQLYETELEALGSF